MSRIIKLKLKFIFLFFLFCQNLFTQNSEFVKTNGSDLILNGKKFYSIGVNCYYLQNLAVKDTNLVNKILKIAKQIGVNTIRTWGFFDSSDSTNPAVIQYAPGQFNEEALRALDYVIYKANQFSIKLIIPLVNNWDDFGGMNQYVRWYAERFSVNEKLLNVDETQLVYGTDGRSYRNMITPSLSHDDFYTNPLIQSWYVDYLVKILTRVNYFNNVRYLDDSTIMLWELANEPRSSDKTGEIVYKWLKDVSEFVKIIDKNHLVGSGEEGFDINRYSYDEISIYPDWMFNGSTGVSFKKNSSINSLDVTGIHFYPEQWGINLQKALGTEGSVGRWLKCYLKIADHNRKPLMINEIGIKKNKYLIYSLLLNQVINSNTVSILLWQMNLEGSEFVDSYSFNYKNDNSVCNLISRYSYRFRDKTNGITQSIVDKNFMQNFPNPFNDISIVTYSVDRPKYIVLEVYNIIGQRITILAEGFHEIGEYQVMLDGSFLTTGLYLIVMRYNAGYSVIKTVYVK